MVSATGTPRGLRNNNPLNLRKSNNKWLGKIKPGTDPAFEQFVTIQYGIRAGLINMRTIIARNSPCSLKKLITIWAPPYDNNNTSAYINKVSQETGLAPDTILNFELKATIISICYAMIKVECGQAVPKLTIESSYELC